jgi:release factor glutamine methyltransferase
LDTVKTLLQKTTLDRVDAKVLLHCICEQHLGWSREQLISQDQEPLPKSLLEHWYAIEALRVQGQPVAYLTQKKYFYQITLFINEHVLIPRPETELLVDTAIAIMTDLLRDSFTPQKPLKILDLGTGSGAIIFAIAEHFKSLVQEHRLQLTATDLSTEALKVATRNSQNLNLSFVKLIHSDWFSALGQQRFDLIISNPPYIAQDDSHLIEGDLRFEPKMALTDGADGLGCYQKIIQESKLFLEPSGHLLLEHGYQQGSAIRGLLHDHNFSQIQTHADLSGIERMTMGQFTIPLGLSKHVKIDA